MAEPVTETPAWSALVEHHARIGQVHLRDLFAADARRGERLVVEVGDLVIDYSKHRVDDAALALLVELARQRHVEERLAAQFRGEHVNPTEDRPALHTALRLPAGRSLHVDGVDVAAEVDEVLVRMRALAHDVRSGAITGATGKPFRHVVNIGIGGSDLGPAMAARALRRWIRDDLQLHFVSNVDGDDLADTLRRVDPETTLFIVASKTFSTIETMTNARFARKWLEDALLPFVLDDIDQGGLGDLAATGHFVALSTDADAVAAFGIAPERTFGFWDWVGGRYSVDSAIGLSLMIGIGPEAFDEFRSGFHVVDEHVATTPLEGNAAAIMALLGVWYRNFLGCQTHAVLPYSDALARFPAYLQQLDMESNGKRVAIDGSPMGVDTAPIVWGEPGTNGQHAFFQLLHQGTSLVPSDLIGFAWPTDASLDGSPHHHLLTANLLAQAEAFAFGRTAEELEAAGVDPTLVPHRTFPGNVPTTTILAPRLTPSVLGQLIALYEHKVAVQGIVWGVNSYDQWGVELGKQLATAIADELESGRDGEHDSSTIALARRYRAMRGN